MEGGFPEGREGQSMAFRERVFGRCGNPFPVGVILDRLIQLLLSPGGGIERGSDGFADVFARRGLGFWGHGMCGLG